MHWFLVVAGAQRSSFGDEHALGHSGSLFVIGIFAGMTPIACQLSSESLDMSSRPKLRKCHSRGLLLEAHRSLGVRISSSNI